MPPPRSSRPSRRDGALLREAVRRRRPMTTSEGESALPDFDLGDLGWMAELAQQLEPGLVPGRVTAVHPGAFDVQTARGGGRTRLPGRVVHRKLDVAARGGCGARRRVLTT